MNETDICYTQSQVELMNEFRTLWEQHVFWTRSFIISTAANLGDLDAVTKRLLRNPADFAEIFHMFYDEMTAHCFKDLFTKHLLIAADLVNAAKENNTQGLENAHQRWFKNADELSAFLAGINDFWDEAVWQSLFYDHLEMTENEAILRLAGSYSEDIEMFDRIELEALNMADYMSYGFINMFNYQ